jgi:cysteine desulfurase
VTGHKLYAPKGIGALYVRNGTPPLRKLMHGAGHEGGQRAGTESTLLAAGLGAACKAAEASLAGGAMTAHLACLRDELQRLLEARFHTLGASEEEEEAVKSKQERGSSPTPLSRGLLKVNGHKVERLPNTLSVSFRGVLATQLLSKVEGRVAASAVRFTGGGA